MKLATIIFPVRGGQIFLAKKKQGFGAGFLNGYGGRQNPEDTSIEHTAVREFHEEAGVEVSPDALEKVAVINFFEEEKPIFECHIFFCRDWQGEFRESDEMAVATPFPLATPPYEQMRAGDRVWLPLICGGQKIRATVRYKSGMKELANFEHKSL